MRAVAFGDLELSLDEILLGAVADGSWHRLRDQLSRGVAAQLAGAVLEQPAVRAAEETFRRRRNLLAAEDLHQWLDERHLTVADWQAHLQRLLLSEAWTGSPAAGKSLAEAARIGVALEDLVFQSALRLLAAAAASGPAPVVENDAVTELVAQAAGDAALPVADRSTDALNAGAATVLRLRARFEQARAAVNPRLVRETIAAQALERTELRYDEVELGTESAAREFVACVRDDGEELGAVAARADAAVMSFRVTGGEAEPQLLGAVPGELLGPVVSRGGGWRVMVLRERVASDPEAPEVWNSVRDAVLEQTLERRLAGRVRWYVRV
jgi:hypothetical protein